MKKVMCVFGTHPEAIKICPLVLEMKKRPSLEVVVCVTAVLDTLAHNLESFLDA